MFLAWSSLLVLATSFQDIVSATSYSTRLAIFLTTLLVFLGAWWSRVYLSKKFAFALTALAFPIVWAGMILVGYLTSLIVIVPLFLANMKYSPSEIVKPGIDGFKFKHLPVFGYCYTALGLAGYGVVLLLVGADPVTALRTVTGTKHAAISIVFGIVMSAYTVITDDGSWYAMITDDVSKRPSISSSRDHEPKSTQTSDATGEPPYDTSVEFSSHTDTPVNAASSPSDLQDGETASSPQESTSSQSDDGKDEQPRQPDIPVFSHEDESGAADSSGTSAESDSGVPDPRKSDPTAATNGSGQGGFPSDPSDKASESKTSKRTARVTPGPAGTQFPWEQPPDVSFGGIGGYADIKEQLGRDVIGPLVSDNPGYERFNVEPSRGILFTGPSGTGKTMFARALASNLGRPFVELNTGNLSSKWINESTELVNQLFDEAQQIGGVVFIDEAESLLGDRDVRLSGHQEDAKVTTTFLSVLSQDNQRFIVILATNMSEKMDDAVLRPGRVDKQFEIGLPDWKARYEILQTKLEGIPYDISKKELIAFAHKLEGKTGADLEKSIKEACIEAAEENAEVLDLEHFDEYEACRLFSVDEQNITKYINEHRDETDGDWIANELL